VGAYSVAATPVDTAPARTAGVSQTHFLDVSIVRCKTCHYSLENLTGPPHRCPECGRAFDPNVWSTFDTPEKYAARRRSKILRTIGIVIFILLFLYQIGVYLYVWLYS
jgi:hypothetical protein